jgi:hypothetical protein
MRRAPRAVRIRREEEPNANQRSKRCDHLPLKRPSMQVTRVCIVYLP